MALEQLEQQLAQVTNAAEAEQLWRMVTAADTAARLMRLHGDKWLRFGKLKLRAERRWGELLGPAEIGRPLENVTASNVSSGSDRAAKHRAREVAEVPAEVFDAYVEKAKDPETLRRGRLLRVAREQAADNRRSEPIEPTNVEGQIETHEIVNERSGVFVVTGDGPEYAEGATVAKVRPDEPGKEWSAVGVQFEKELTLTRDQLVTFMRCRTQAKAVAA